MLGQRKRRDSLWVIGDGPTADINESYTLGQALGQPGQFGRAVMAVPKNGGEPCAVKIISKARFGRKLDALRQEIEVMRNLKHANIIRLFDVFEDKAQLYLVLELCAGGELFDRITAMGQYNEKDAAAVIRQVLTGVAHMHSKSIAHCDLKPDNLLFRDEGNDLKVIDFGMSKFAKPRMYFSRFCGTPYYVAPEVIDGKYDEACDVWSVGVILFVVLFGYPPFYADPARFPNNLADERVYYLIKRGFEPVVKSGYGPHFPKAIPVSDAARDLIARLLVHDTKKRLTAVEALEHPWVTGDAASETPIARSVVAALKAFNGRAKLKHHVLTAMASSLSEQQVEELRRTFKAMDKDGDGSITAEELQAALQDVDGGAAAADAAAILAGADQDGDGRLSYDEILHAYVNRQLVLKEERMFDAFCKMDSDGNGFITADELKAALKDVEGGMSDDKIAEMIAEVDRDGDGNISYSEFLDVFTRSE